MKVTIFNGSPMRNDRLSSLTSETLKMIQSGGGKAEEYFLYFMDIKGCINCGVSRPDDELKLLIDEFVSSDIAVFASPLYPLGLSGSLKIFIEELFSQSKFDEKLAERIRGKKIAVMITANEGCDEDDAVRPLRILCESFGMNFAGAFDSIPDMIKRA